MGSKAKYVAIGVGIAVAIGIGIALALSGLQNSTSGSGDTASSDSRTVFWIHVHGLGIDPSDSSILYIATHGDFYQSVNGAPPVKVDKQRADYMAS
jgi:hypothetical protein